MGSLFIVSLVLAAGSMTGNTMIVNAAVAKTSLPWGTVRSSFINLFHHLR